MSKSRAEAKKRRLPEANWTFCSTSPAAGSPPSRPPSARPSANAGHSPARIRLFISPGNRYEPSQTAEGNPMRGVLVLTIAAAAGSVFAQGLGVTPALPDGVSALTITSEAGPWMILAASFVGRPARGQAEELATEIRNRYNLPAYVFNRTAEERRIEQERIERLKAEQRKKLAQDGLDPDTPVHIKTVRIEDQYAVLVGGYKDDVAARKELEKIRKLKPSDKFAVY